MSYRCFEWRRNIYLHFCELRKCTQMYVMTSRHLAISTYKMPVRRHVDAYALFWIREWSFQASFRNTVRASNTLTLPLFCEVMVNLPFSNAFGLVESCQSTLSFHSVLISLLHIFGFIGNISALEQVPCIGERDKNSKMLNFGVSETV